MLKRSWIKRGNSTLKRSPLKQRSVKKILRNEIDKAQLEYLKLARHNEHRCEICGHFCSHLNRFHILPVGMYPNMEYIDENVLLTDWFPCHNDWHHDYEKAKFIKQRLIKLLGPDYKEKLIALNAMQPKQSEMILGAKLHWYKIESENLRKPEHL
jgi:hypothetical protein